jgi:MFS family permease
MFCTSQDMFPRSGTTIASSETMATPLPKGSSILTTVPHRLDRLPWSAWHWRVLVALGITWTLDGLEVTLVGALASVLGEPDTLALSPSQIGGAGSVYLAGAILGAVVFGRLTDAFGRKRLFLVTLAMYIAGTLATAFAWDFVSFAVLRAITGAGIGGEGAAVASAIDELMPARVRGRVAIAISGTYWLGTALGSALTLVLLSPDVLPHSIGWRVCFAGGGLLGLSILLVRRHLPESPRWLLLHGYPERADEIVSSIEREVGAAPSSPAIEQRVEVKGHVSLRHVAHVLFSRRPKRTALALTLIASQAFVYNAIFFTYALVLGRFYGVAPSRVGLYLLPFAAGNLIGPLALGHLFDTIGRRVMIAATYIVSGILLVGTGYAFARGWLSATTQTALWCAVFFFASAAASAAYLTVSEIFPVEVRALCIALFYAAGTAIGGLTAPALFGALIESGSRVALALGYGAGAALMLGAAIVELVIGVPAEGRSLEDIAEIADEARAPRLRLRRDSAPAAASKG